MMKPPDGVNAFEFVVMAALRTAQLMRGCIPRVPNGHKPTTTAQLEVVGGHIRRLQEPPKGDAAAGPHNEGAGERAGASPAGRVD